MLKEVVKGNKLEYHISYTTLYAYTDNPLKLDINAISGDIGLHVLMEIREIKDFFSEKGKFMFPVCGFSDQVNIVCSVNNHI